GGVRLTVVPAARDLPVLVRDISIALTEIVRLDVPRIETALRVVKAPIEQARLVGRTIIGQLSASVNRWLVVDDYQVLMSSRAGEELIATLESSGRFRIMVVSRERPSWARSRRFF